MFWIVRSIALLALAACTPRAQPPDTIPAPPGVTTGTTGVIRIVGSAPVNVQVVLQPPGGGSIRLVGPLRDELETLAGAEVRVYGEVAPSPDPLADRVLDASGYEIVAVDDRPAIVGEIVSVTGDIARLRTSNGQEVVLEATAGAFQPGQKVWVQGPQRVTVQAFGVLRP